MGIGEIKTQILGLFGQGDERYDLAAALTPIPFKYEPSPITVEVKRMRQCADAYREIKKIGPQVTWIATLRFMGALVTGYCTALVLDNLNKGDVLRAGGSIIMGISYAGFTIWANKHYQEAARHEENLIQLYNATCRESPSPNPLPVKIADTHHEIVGVSAEAMAARHSAWALFARDVGVVTDKTLSATGHCIVAGAQFVRDHPGKTALGIGAGALILFQPELAPLLAL